MRKLAPAGAGPALILGLALLSGLILSLPVPSAAQEAGDVDPLPVLRPSVPDCPVCEFWNRHEAAISRARQEVGSLQDGVIYFFHSDRPGVIEPLIRLAYERRELQQDLPRDAGLRDQLGGPCGHDLLGAAMVRVEISVGAHGFFVILTSDRSATVDMLHEEASQAVRGKLVRF